MNKVILTCAITGSIHTPSMSPHLPITPDEIANSAIEAAHAGASVVHLHARNPQTGQPTQDVEIYRQYLPKIVEACDVVINITTGGSPILPLTERLQPALTLAAR
ncbi:3-keto-5-aminohexanoate cleavage enzyme [Sphingobium faniae]|nr:3-keto-5-aminohexanoate cleavage enzyme [Sphingobium faniae]